MKIKICGLMRERDVRLLGELHADIAGFVTEYPIRVPWNLTSAEAARLMAAAPPGLKTCIVTGGEREKTVSLIRELRPDFVQLHFNETLHDTEYIVRALSPLGIGVIKTLPMTAKERIERLGTADIGECARLLGGAGVYAILCDSRTPANASSSTEAADFGIYDELRRESPVPVILAGGITEENIGKTAASYEPYMVDIMTGAESAPGIKDEAKLRNILKFRTQV
ncbi:MAG: phosphoribosylanthranilate isomerase [Clostridia bacterium]|nr:phosphoribosylanthranilate isomerase [Clostridia bacterium]